MSEEEKPWKEIGPGSFAPDFSLGTSVPGTIIIKTGSSSPSSPPPGSELVGDYLKEKYAEKPKPVYNSKVAPVTDWFATEYADNLMFSRWQQYTCKGCGEELAGSKYDSMLKSAMEMHVLRHQLLGEVSWLPSKKKGWFRRRKP